MAASFSGGCLGDEAGFHSTRGSPINAAVLTGSCLCWNGAGGGWGWEGSAGGLWVLQQGIPRDRGDLQESGDHTAGASTPPDWRSWLPMRLPVPSLGLVMGQHKQPGYHTHSHMSVPRGWLLPTLVLGGGCCTPHPRVLALRPSCDLETLINGSKTQGFFTKSQCVTSTRAHRTLGAVAPMGDRAVSL